MGQTPHLAPLRRYRTTVLALLATMATLGCMQALAPSPAMAATDQGDKCASLPEIWEQLACEEEHGGSGGSTQPSEPGEVSKEDAGKKATYQPFTVDPYFDSIFDESKYGRLEKIWGVTSLQRLSVAYAHCRKLWWIARQATHRNPRRLFWLLRSDPNDVEVQEDVGARWQDNHCSQVFDTVGLP